jgi:hypothetical protein
MTRWYHGGPPIDGRWLLPPAITGALSGAGLFAAVFGVDPAEAGVEEDRASQQHVFLTSSRQLARAHAAAVEPCGRGPFGVVYECWPVTLEPDPDSEDDFPGLNVQEPFATIVRVVESPVELSLAQMERIMMRYTTALPGFTKDDLRAQNAELARRLAAGEDVRPQFASAPRKELPR